MDPQKLSVAGSPAIHTKPQNEVQASHSTQEGRMERHPLGRAFPRATPAVGRAMAEDLSEHGRALHPHEGGTRR